MTAAFYYSVLLGPIDLSPLPLASVTDQFGPEAFRVWLSDTLLSKIGRDMKHDLLASCRPLPLPP